MGVRRRTIRVGFAVIFAAWFLCSCGIKSNPIDDRLRLPDRVSEPCYEFDEEGYLQVAFNPPLKDINGANLGDLGGFVVERSENELTPDFCSTCPVKYTHKINIKADKPPVRLDVADRPYSFKDRLKPGYVYYYRIHAKSSSGKYDPSLFRRLVIHYDSPSRPPREFKIKSDNRLVVLQWTAPDRLIDGRELNDLEGYNVYRRKTGENWKKLNGGRPVRQNFYRDEDTVNGETYEYKIRAVRKWRETLIEGPPAAGIRGIPTDLTPPPPPANVFLASFNDGVKLAWPGVETTDLAGYRVYRRKSGETRFSRIGPELLNENYYLDEEAVVGTRYEYRVTSVDGSPNANESDPSEEAGILHTP